MQVKLRRPFWYILKYRFNLSILVIWPILTFGQNIETQELWEIIADNQPAEIRQQKIDSFLLSKKNTLSKYDLADLYHNIGNKWYYANYNEQGNKIDLENAIAYTQRAVEAKSNLDSLDINTLKKSLYNLGYFISLKDDIYEAISTYYKLINLGQEEIRTQKAKFELGLLYETIGDIYKALASFKSILAYNNNNFVDPALIVGVHIELASTYGKMGFREYSEHIAVQLKMADSILNNEDSLNERQLLEVYQMEGNRLLMTDNFNKAITYYKKIISDSTALFPQELAFVHNSFGLSLVKLKKYDEALSHLRNAIQYDKTFTHPYENLGDLYLAQNQFEKGLFNYQKAISIATGTKEAVKFNALPNSQELEVATDKISLLGHLIAKANGWLKYYQFDSNKKHLEEALKTFSLADGLIDVIRSESTEYQSKLFWREKGASLYMNAVEVCYLLKKPEAAFHFMERNKALLLLEDITGEQAKEIAKLPQSMAKREFELKRAIYLAENELQNTSNPSKGNIDGLTAKVFKSKRIYDVFTDSLTTFFPDYAKLKKQVNVLAYAKFLENYISNDEVVLHYILNNEQGYGLLSAKGHPYFFKLENVPGLNNKLVQLYGLLTDQTSDRARRAEYNTLAQQIFIELVPKVVFENIKGKKLTLVNDFILQQIPFEALVTDAQNSKYLIEDTEIRYAYSISYLDAKMQSKGQATKDLMGLAPVQFASLGLASLNFSHEEVGGVEKIFGGKLVLNEAATKNRFLADQNDFKIVHLSTHADVGEGGNPWIAFSDAKLFLNEIYALKNQSDMVVLSGCNTSIGELKKGEGAMSLARGFFHSGAKSVVSSLWTINDKKSKELITEFYIGLSQGMTKSEAMQNAKIKFLAKYRNSLLPSYWASLIVIGDNATLVQTGLTNVQWGLLGAGGLLLVFVFYGFRRKRLKRNQLIF